MKIEPMAVVRLPSGRVCAGYALQPLDAAGDSVGMVVSVDTDAMTAVVAGDEYPHTERTVSAVGWTWRTRDEAGAWSDLVDASTPPRAAGEDR